MQLTAERKTQVATTDNDYRRKGLQEQCARVRRMLDRLESLSWGTVPLADAEECAKRGGGAFLKAMADFGCLMLEDCHLFDTLSDDK